MYGYLALLLLFAAYHVWLWRRPKTTFPKALSALPLNSESVVSLLVPAWDAAHDIPAFVAAFRSLSYPHKELILCVGGSDGGLELAQQLAADDVVVLEQRPGEGKQVGLAKCFAASCGDVLYLTDIDCRSEDVSFSLVLHPVLTGKEAVVTGSSRPLDAQLGHVSVLMQWAVTRKVTGMAARYTDGILGRNCALTRAAAHATGSFHFAAPTGTDYRLAQALTAQGYRIWLEPLSEIPTEYAWPLLIYARKQARWLRNVLLFAERPRQNAERLMALSTIALPTFMVLALPVSLVALLLLPPALAFVPMFLALLLFCHGLLIRPLYLRDALGLERVGPRVLRGALSHWLGQLYAGLYALYTWSVPALRKQW